MLLAEYLKETGLTPQAWAKKAGIHQALVYRYLAGDYCFGRKNALKAVWATDHCCSIYEILYGELDPDPKKLFPENGKPKKRP